MSPLPVLARRAWRASLLVGVLLGGSCFAERRGLSRDGLLKDLEATAPEAGLPTLEELVALRAPEPPPRPASVDAMKPTRSRDVARLAMVKGDVKAAEAAWEAAWKAGGADRVETLADRCFAEAVLRRYDHVLTACAAFLDTAPEDPRAVAVARVLARSSPARRAAADLVARAGPGWVKKCASRKGACADLAYVVAGEAVSTARAVGERARFEDAVLSSGRLRRARVEGPFDGDVRVLLAQDLKKAELPPWRPHFRAFAVVDDDGVFSPAQRAADGLYRLRLEGRSSADTRATLYVTGSGAVRVRVDGVIVAERSTDLVEPAVTRAAVELEAGDHVVEILAESAGAGDQIGVAFLDDAGAPALTEAISDAKRASRPAKARVVKLAGAVEALAVPLSPSDPGAGHSAGASANLDALYRLVARHAVSRPPSLGPPTDEVKQIARVMVRDFGWSPLALSVAAEIVGDDASVPRRVASTTASRLWERVRVVWPDHPVAAISVARDLREERPDEALTAYRNLVAQRPDYPFGHRELIDLALDTGLVDEARASADALLRIEESPENIDAAGAALRASGDLARAEALDEKRALLDPDQADTRIARRLLSSGRTDEGLEALARAAARDPGSSAADEHIELLALRDPAAALARVDALLVRYPDDDHLLGRKAELLRHVRGDDDARRFVLDALPLARGSDRVARLAERLGVQQPWASRLRLGDDAIAALRARDPAPFAGHGALALIDDVERVIHDDDTSLVIRHFVVELRTKEALDRFGEIGTGDARVIRLRVVKPDGAVIEAERHRGVDDASFPALAPGDIVELLSVSFSSSSRNGGVFEMRALDGMSMPALSRRYLVSFPEGWDQSRKLQVFAHNGLARPLRTAGVDGEGRKRVALEFALTNVDAERGEPFMPGDAEVARIGGFAWGIDDAFWARMRGVPLEQAAIGDAWLHECARRIAGTGTPEEKLRRIFTFVVRRIEPEASPELATAALATGQGQRTPLFLALARAAGLDATPVALHLENQPSLEIVDASSWSIIAVRVRMDGRESFAVVDGNAVLDALPPYAKNARVLDLSLTPRGDLVSTLPDRVIDDSPVLVQVDLAAAAAPADGDGPAPLAGLVVVTIPASKADGARRGAQRATPEQLLQVLERSLADTLPGLRVLEVKTPDVEAFGGPLRLGARVEVPMPELVDGAARFEHLFASGASGGLQLTAPLTSYLAAPDRKYPLLVAADGELLEVQIALPPAAAFVEAPESMSLRAGPFQMRQRVEITNGVLYWRRELRTENARVPVASWPRVRAELAKLAARTDARLSFVLPAPAAPR